MTCQKRIALEALGKKIVSCRKCRRLVDYASKVSEEKVRRYRDWDYWGRPLPAFGDPGARLLIIGLAPAAHGGKRTGRMFTGDSSGDWLSGPSTMSVSPTSPRAPAGMTGSS